MMYVATSRARDLRWVVGSTKHFLTCAVTPLVGAQAAALRQTMRLSETACRRVTEAGDDIPVMKRESCAEGLAEDGAASSLGIYLDSLLGSHSQGRAVCNVAFVIGGSRLSMSTCCSASARPRCPDAPRAQGEAERPRCSRLA